MRFERIIHTNRDVPILAQLPVAGIAAGSGTDPAQDFAFYTVPSLKYGLLPKEYNESVQGELPVNRMAARVVGFISQGAANLLGVAANNADIRVNVWRNKGGAAVLQGCIARYSLSVATTLGTAIVAGNINTVVTVTPAAMTGIVNGMALGIGAGGVFEVVIATNVTSTTFQAQFNQLHATSDVVTSVFVPNRLIPFVPADGGVNTTSGTAVASTGSQTVTPTTMYGIHVGDSLLVDSAVTPEVVVVTAVTATTFTAVYASTHLINFTVVTNNAYGAVANGSPFEIREDDVVTWNRISNNATGIATPAGLLVAELVPSRLLQ